MKKLMTSYRKVYDYENKKIVSIDNTGKDNGRPVLTSAIIRKLRNTDAISVLKDMGLSKELIQKWVPLIKSTFLVTYDFKGNYKESQYKGFEDEEGMMRVAMRYENLNLPPDAIARLKEIRRKKKLD